MTRYEQLVDSALPCARKHFEYFEACQRLAFSLAAGYANFLEYPRDGVVFVHLDQDLNRTEKTEFISAETPLVFGDDGFWYFCIRIRYEKGGNSAYMVEHIKLGLKIVGTVTTVRGDSDVEVDTTSPGSIEEFFYGIFNDTLERFKTLPFIPTKRIGFVM